MLSPRFAAVLAAVAGAVLLADAADAKGSRGDTWPRCNSQYELDGAAKSVSIPRCRETVTVDSSNNTIRCGENKLCGVYCFDHANDPPTFDCSAEGGGGGCGAMAWALPLTALCGIGLGWAITFCYYRRKFGQTYSGYIEVN